MNILIHTCGGESEAMLATTKAEDPCACGDEMYVDDICCKTELKTVKIDDVQTAVSIHVEQNLTLIGIVPVQEISTFNIHHLSFVIAVDTSPPSNKDFQIANSVFLI